MLKRLIDFVVQSPASSKSGLTLQDITLCRNWAQSPTPGTPVGTLSAVEATVTQWMTERAPGSQPTCGRRHQILLRELVDHLVKHGTTTLGVEEAAFLQAALTLARATGTTRDSERVTALLAPHESALAARAGAHAPAYGLVPLERRIAYASENDVLAAPSNFIRLLAGIEMPCRGPVFKCQTNLRLLGDVPDGCTVVVENDGYCSVDGYVMGRVLSRRHCEIRHNLSGSVIVLSGNIRARGIINNGTAISKMGSVHCVNAQGPRLVFAGQAIEVEENALMGRYVTRDMRVGREVRGSRLEIAGDCTAGYFRHLGMSHVSVVLRRELSCADFGEVTGADLNQLLSRAYSLRRQARNFFHLAAAARGEADHNAQSVLMFTFGGGEVQKRLETLLRAQRRHAFISHVVENLRAMLNEVREEMLQPEGAAAVSTPQTAGVFDELDDEELRTVQDEAASLEKTLRATGNDHRQTTLLLEQARQKLAAMEGLQAQMAAQMAQEERAMQNMEKYEQILSGSGQAASKLDVLNRILPALQSQPVDGAIGKRIRSPFAVRALRTIERAVRRAGELEQRANEFLVDFRGVSERLGRDFQIRVLENPEDEGNIARVTGAFEGGARIFMDSYVENLSEAPTDSVVVTPNEDGIRTYVRRGAGARFYSAG